MTSYDSRLKNLAQPHLVIFKGRFHNAPPHLQHSYTGPENMKYKFRNLNLKPLSWE